MPRSGGSSAGARQAEGQGMGRQLAAGQEARQIGDVIGCAGRLELVADADCIARQAPGQTEVDDIAFGLLGEAGEFVVAQLVAARRAKQR
jgi:hypothetical protein